MGTRSPILYEEKKNMIILMDERIDHIDERETRVIFSAVEIPEVDKIIEYKKIFTNLHDKWNRKTKFHFTDINDPKVRNAIVEEISKLNVRVKIYIYYAFNVSESVAKENALRWAIKSTQISLGKRYRLDFLVENAIQYKKMIRSRNLIDEEALTIIPDVFCYVFAIRLDLKRDKIFKERLINLGLIEGNKYDELFNIRWFNQLYNKICLEVYWDNDKAVSHRRRGELLAPVLKK